MPEGAVECALHVQPGVGRRLVTREAAAQRSDSPGPLEAEADRAVDPARRQAGGPRRKRAAGGVNLLRQRRDLASEAAHQLGQACGVPDRRSDGRVVAEP
jgi:hypothetical protein